MKKIGHIAGRPIWDSEGEQLLKGSLIANIERSEIGEITGMTINLKESQRVPPMNQRPIKPSSKYWISYKVYDSSYGGPKEIMNLPWKDYADAPEYVSNIQQILLNDVDITDKVYSVKGRASGPIIPSTMHDFSSSDYIGSFAQIKIILKQPIIHGDIFPNGATECIINGYKVDTTGMIRRNIVTFTEPIQIMDGAEIESNTITNWETSSIIVPKTVTNLTGVLFGEHVGIIDFSALESIPVLESIGVFQRAQYEAAYWIVVPKNLFNDWRQSTNWSNDDIYRRICYRDDDGQLSFTQV